MIIEKGVMFGDLPQHLQDQGWTEDGAGFVRNPRGEIVAREFGAEMRGQGVVSLGDIVRTTVEKLTDQAEKEILKPAPSSIFKNWTDQTEQGLYTNAAD